MKRKNKFDEWFLLTWKKVWKIVVAWILSVVLHNAVYGIFKSYFDARGGDEAFFLIIALIIIPLYVLVVLIYSLVKIIKKHQ